MKPLRPYQEEALQAIRDTVKQGVRRLVVQAPTGSGKTRVAAEIGLGAQSKGNRLVFVVPAISLIDQTVDMFHAEGIRDIGVIQADHPLTDWSKPIQVASIQTIRARERYPEAKVVIIDECHNLHKEHIQWMGRLNDEGLPIDCPAWENVPFIGLSATPWTKGLGRYFQSLLVMSTADKLIKEGFLAPFRVFAADHPDLSGVKITRGDYQEGQLSAVMCDQGLVANIIDTYKSRWNKGKTFCFGVDCAHAKALQERFTYAGISCAYQDARTPASERKEIKEGFHSGKYDVVCNVGTLTTGVDWDVRCLILARPTRSEILFVQIIGRALRPAEGKDKAIILDHTDTTSRLGFVTDIHREILSMGKFDGEGETAKRAPPLPKPCPQCTCLIPVGVKICPECGFERKVTSAIYEEDGELVEFDGVYRKKGDRNASKRQYTIQEKASFFAQLKWYCAMKGYKEGWAAMKYKEKFQVWPDWSIRGVRPMVAGPEVTQWIRHVNIQWARDKRNPANLGKKPGWLSSQDPPESTIEGSTLPFPE